MEEFTIVASKIIGVFFLLVAVTIVIASMASIYNSSQGKEVGERIVLALLAGTFAGGAGAIVPVVLFYFFSFIVPGDIDEE